MMDYAELQIKIRAAVWEEYQPRREREKEFYDIRLRDGEVVCCCYPNGIHWNPMLPSNNGKLIADYRVTHIRFCQPPYGFDENPARTKKNTTQGGYPIGERGQGLGHCCGNGCIDCEFWSRSRPQEKGGKVII